MIFKSTFGRGNVSSQEGTNSNHHFEISGTGPLRRISHPDNGSSPFGTILGAQVADQRVSQSSKAAIPAEVVKKDCKWSFLDVRQVFFGHKVVFVSISSV